VLTDIFNDDIKEQIMNHYRDYSYVNDILNNDFEDGYKLYIKCIERINESLEKEAKDKAWGLYLIKLENGYEGNFEDFCKTVIKNDSNHVKMSSKETINNIRDKVKNL
jgi:hypothetical protein